MITCPELDVMRRMSVKLDQELMRKAKIVSAAREQTVIEYLEGLISPLIQRDVEEELRKLASDTAHAAPPPTGPKRPRKGD